MGAADALEAAKIPRDQILIGGVDGRMTDRRHGGTADPCDVFQDATLEGGRAVDDAVKLIRHEPVQQYDWIPFELVTDKTLLRYVKS